LGLRNGRLGEVAVLFVGLRSEGLREKKCWGKRAHSRVIQAEAWGYLEASATTTAKTVVERFEWCAGMDGVAGPSTAPFAKCANGFAQDDEFVVGEGKQATATAEELDAEADEDDGHGWGFGAAVVFDGDAEALGGDAFWDVRHDYAGAAVLVGLEGASRDWR